jgi:hypothetical protein
MVNAMLIGVLIAIIIAAIAWAATRREGFDNWDSLNIPGNELKFADRGGGCSAGFTKITDGSNKGMCAPDRYAQGQTNAPSPAPPPPPPQAPAPRPAPPRAPAPAPMRKQNWLEKLSESQDPLSAGKGGANAKPVEYNQGSNRKRPNITIASSGSKFRPKQGDGKCPAGFVGITSGTRKGMCVKSEYARGGTPSGPSRVSGSKFSSKVNGKCPNGFSEITAGGHKGQCIKWEYAGKTSVSRSSSPSRRSSGSSGSKFISKVDGRCPSGTSEITAGGHKGECINKWAADTIERNKKLKGSMYIGRELAKCPKGTVMITSGPRKGMCVDPDKVVERNYPYWGWGPNAGLRCKNPDNTGCNTKYDNKGKMKTTEYKQKLTDKYPYWGWGANAGLRCANKNNTGCNTKYLRGALVEGNGKPNKPAPAPKPASSGGIHWGWGPHAGMQCKNADNTGCSFDYAKKPEPKIQVPNFGSNWTPGWGGNKGMKCRGSVPNTNCTWN